MRRLVDQAEAFESFRFGIAFLIQPFMLVKFIDHFGEFFTIDGFTDNIRSAAQTGFVEIAVVQGVAFLQIVAG